MEESTKQAITGQCVVCAMPARLVVHVGGASHLWRVGLLEKLMTKPRSQGLGQSSENSICKGLAGRGSTVHLVDLEVISYGWTMLPCPV